MANRYFIQLAYNGKNYCGWQIQPNGLTVQEKLMNAVSTITREKVDVVGAGRTDTGVHASFFVAHFELENEIADLEHFCFKLNSILPKDIKVGKVFPVEGEMHARFSALSRTYQYFISQSKEPFREDITAHFYHPLTIGKMNEAAQALFDYIDFTSFSKLHTDVKTNNCKIMCAEWREERGLLVFEIKADRFLRNMVRAIVGTLVDVGRGKISTDDVRRIIEAKDRGGAGSSVPASGLFLTDIEYTELVNLKLVRQTILF